MQKLPASIFNDVIGPVMRGPSSSHVAGAARIGSLVRQSLGGKIKSVLVEFDPNGSLAESYHGHGSDIGFVSGLLNIDLTDERVKDACSIAEREDLEVRFSIVEYGAEHPNNYRITATAYDGAIARWEAVSVGGGMIEMQIFNGFPVSIDGGWHELLVTVEENPENTAMPEAPFLPLLSNVEALDRQLKDGLQLLNFKCSGRQSAEAIEKLRRCPRVRNVAALEPILPTPSRADCRLPFATAQEMLDHAANSGKSLWEMAALYESMRGGTSEEDVFDKMGRLLEIMENAAENGLRGTQYEDRILGPQARKLDNPDKGAKLLPDPLIANITKYITAIMEVKSSMGVIVAAPTAGSCGGLPGTVIGLGRTLSLPRETMIQGMLAAGLIGVFIAESATFAAEVAGCQVECGAGSGMAAAAVCQMLGGSLEQCVDAASMALQNITGLACDPVANRVEVPCLGKNVMGGMNALASANMALAGFDKVIPLDQTIAAIYDIGLKLPLELRCTFGGLGKTPASLKIRSRLA